MGVSGCGKSTTGAALAKALGWPFRDADSFHPPANIDKMSRGAAPRPTRTAGPGSRPSPQWIDERCGAGRARHRLVLGAEARLPRSASSARGAGVRLVYLKGDRALIGRRLEARRHHFMPASLLESQFATLEEPRADERPVVVNVAMSPRRVVATILERLGLEARAEGG